MLSCESKKKLVKCCCDGQETYTYSSLILTNISPEKQILAIKLWLRIIQEALWLDSVFNWSIFHHERHTAVSSINYTPVGVKDMVGPLMGLLIFSFHHRAPLNGTDYTFHPLKLVSPRHGHILAQISPTGLLLSTEV